MTASKAESNASSVESTVEYKLEDTNLDTDALEAVSDEVDDYLTRVVKRIANERTTAVLAESVERVGIRTYRSTDHAGDWFEADILYGDAA